MDSMTQDTLILSILAALGAFIIWLVFRARQTKVSLQYHRLEVLNRMIDKFGSGEEFATFLQSDQGQKLLHDTDMHAHGPHNGKKTAALRYLQAAIIINVIGAGFMINGDTYSGATDPNLIHKSADLFYWGTMSITLAAGLYLVALITYLWNRRVARELTH